MEVFLADISGWDGTSVVGVYSSKDAAMRGCVEYLLLESVAREEMMPAELKVERDDFWSYAITNSGDYVRISKLKVKN